MRDEIAVTNIQNLIIHQKGREVNPCQYRDRDHMGPREKNKDGKDREEKWGLRRGKGRSWGTEPGTVTFTYPFLFVQKISKDLNHVVCLT